MTITSYISIEQFGKDHWSTLAFVETRCVDYKGVLDKDKMRCNLNKHATFAGPRQQNSLIMNWQESWGTCLKDGTILSEHDDWDCLIDLAKANLVEIIDIDEGNICLTEAGRNVTHQLRVFKMQGGKYGLFSPVM